MACVCRKGALSRLYGPGPHHDHRCPQYRPIRDKLAISVTMHRKPSPASLTRGVALTVRSSCETIAGISRQKGLQPEFDSFRVTFDAIGFLVTIEGDRVAWETLRDLLTEMLRRLP